MLGFRLEKDTIISRDLLFVKIAFIIMLSLWVYGESGNSVFDRINLDFPYKALFLIIASAIVALGVAYAIVKVLSIFLAVYLMDTILNTMYWINQSI